MEEDFKYVTYLVFDAPSHPGMNNSTFSSYSPSSWVYPDIDRFMLIHSFISFLFIIKGNYEERVEYIQKLIEQDKPTVYAAVVGVKKVGP